MPSTSCLGGLFKLRISCPSGPRLLERLLPAPESLLRKPSGNQVMPAARFLWAVTRTPNNRPASKTRTTPMKTYLRLAGESVAVGPGVSLGTASPPTW